MSNRETERDWERGSELPCRPSDGRASRPLLPALALGAEPEVHLGTGGQGRSRPGQGELDHEASELLAPAAPRLIFLRASLSRGSFRHPLTRAVSAAR